MYTELLRKNFAPSSANCDLYKNTWYESASLFIPQINKLINHNPIIKDINSFEINNSTYLLKKILDEFGSDKATTHNYYILYNYICTQLGLNKNLNILEIGLGTNNPTLISTMGINGRPGASLKAFKKFLINSNIYGADIDKNILFNEDRISTVFVNQLEIDTFNNLGSIKYDMIIDDGLHSVGANLNTIIFALQHIKPNGWIIIEDIDKNTKENWNIIDHSLKDYKYLKLETYLVSTTHKYLYVVHCI